MKMSDLEKNPSLEMFLKISIFSYIRACEEQMKIKEPVRHVFNEKYYFLEVDNPTTGDFIFKVWTMESKYDKTVDYLKFIEEPKLTTRNLTEFLNFFKK